MGTFYLTTSSQIKHAGFAEQIFLVLDIIWVAVMSVLIHQDFMNYHKNCMHTSLALHCSNILSRKSLYDTSRSTSIAARAGTIQARRRRQHRRIHDTLKCFHYGARRCLNS